MRLSRLLPVIRNQRQAAWHHASRHTALIAPPRIYLDICIYLYSKLRLCTRTRAGQDHAPLSSHRKLLKVRKLCSQIILHDLQFAFIFRQSNYYSTWTNCQSRAISSSQFIGLSFYQTIAFSYLFNHNLDFVSSGNDKTHKSFDLLWSATRYDFPVNKTHILTHHKFCGVISKYLVCSILYLIIVWTQYRVSAPQPPAVASPASSGAGRRHYTFCSTLFCLKWDPSVFIYWLLLYWKISLFKFASIAAPHPSAVCFSL